MARFRFTLAVITAFLIGLLFASAMDFTAPSYAQQETVPSQQEVRPLAEVSNAFVSIAETVTPSVVSIETQRNVDAQRGRQQQRAPIPPGFEDFFRQFEFDVPDRPVQGTGSGFIVSRDGYILTNNHVVEGADRVTVRLVDGRTFRATVVGTDPTTDVAVIKIDADNLNAVRLGNDETMRIGDWVLAIGNPLGLDFTVTAGIVSAKGRSVANLLPSRYAISDYIQTDAAINPGNSGGPLVNIRGEVIGINNAIASRTGFYQGYGFAIPITLAREVMEDLIAHGRVRRAMLGVSINDVDAVDARAAGLDEVRGVKVGGFTGEDSPARRAGLEPGDVIISADGRPVDRVSTLQRIVRSKGPGATLEFEVMRFGTRRTFRVRLAEAPTEPTVAAAERSRPRADVTAGREKLGVSVQSIPGEIARQANLRETEIGVMVTEVAPGGPAHNRLFERDVILEILNPGPRRQVRSVEDFQRAISGLKAGDHISLFVYSLGTRERQTRVVNIRVAG